MYVADDHSRVILHDCGPEYDYINASYISVIVLCIINFLIILITMLICSYLLYAVTLLSDVITINVAEICCSSECI